MDSQARINDLLKQQWCLPNLLSLFGGSKGEHVAQAETDASGSSSASSELLHCRINLHASVDQLHDLIKV